MVNTATFMHFQIICFAIQPRNPVRLFAVYPEQKQALCKSLEQEFLEHFQFEILRISNHTACRFAEKAQFFRSVLAGRRCAAASRFAFFKGETL